MIRSEAGSEWGVLRRLIETRVLRAPGANLHRGGWHAGWAYDTARPRL